ncbi:hypothetical protein [Nonomuraea sp. 10N515B]|uniref:hypothetical protein n=1 Tax=Nonomuraea sp. 10N515B TaxID=3457422 RepID=UPI003FCE786B
MDVRLSVAIMHHPRRADRLPALLASCAPLSARVVVDPDPASPPSPLRTAKRAWAAGLPAATHHLVLQDDVRLSPGFAEHLLAAIRHRPKHAIALYSNWNSPQNSYLVRRAAATGSAWAPLSGVEWIPTQGLVLPAARARDLAVFLAPISDDVRDDDEMIALFCAEQGIPAVATVPHLLDHADEQSLAGHPGSFHATVYADGRPLAPHHWDGGQDRRPGGLAVELIDSRCFLRLSRPGEPVEHPFGWYWADWSALIGLEPRQILRAAPGDLPSYARELWAAAYILGADAAGEGGRGGWILHEAISSWVSSGLSDRDRAGMDARSRAALIDMGVAAVEHGRTAARPRRLEFIGA